MAKGRKVLANANIFFAGINNADLKSASPWINNLGGRTSSNMNSHVTHVVCSEAAWYADHHKVLAKAFDEDDKRSKGNEIKFVSFQWIEDCATTKSKKSEGPYRCERIWASKKAHSAAGANADGKVPREPRAHKGMVTDMIAEQTEKHLDERSRKEIEDAIRQKDKRERIEEAARLEEERAQRRKTAETFSRGAKKARNDIFSENHHIYVDETGFKHDVSLTKVDARLNRNERFCITIQIYESNAQPHTYATNLHFAGTAHLAKNNLLTALGANFPTAFRSFKMAFKEHTKIDWDDRIMHSLKRAEIVRNERAPRAGSDAESKPGVPVASEFVRQTMSGKPFDQKPFEYHPPAHGPKGFLPKEKQEEITRMVGNKGPRRVESEKIEAWMSGANGAGPEHDPNNNTGMHADRDMRGEVIDLNEDLAPRSGSFNDGAIPLNQNGDYDFEAASPKPVQPAEFEDLMEVTYGFGNDYTVAFETENSAQPMALNESTNAVFNQDANESDGGLFGTEVEISFPNNSRAEVIAEEGEAATVDATQFASFDLPPSTVAETASFQPGTQDPGESMRAEKICREMEEALDNTGATAENGAVGLNQGLGFAEEFLITADQAPAATEPAPTTQGRPAGKLNLGSSMLGKRKAHEVLADEVAGDNVSKKAKQDGQGEGETGAEGVEGSSV